MKISIKSFIVTLGIFLTLPFFEFFYQVKKEESPMKIYTINTSFVSLPKRNLSKKEKFVFPKKVKREKIKLNFPEKKKEFFPMPVALSLSFNPNIKGDFNVKIPKNLTFTPHIKQVKEVFNISDIDSPPYPVIKILPIYPFSARMKGIEGNVELSFIVEKDGSVSNIEVKNATSEIFIDPAIKAVKRWRFKPGIKEGKVVRTKVFLPISFVLKD